MSVATTYLLTKGLSALPGKAGKLGKSLSLVIEKMGGCVWDNVKVKKLGAAIVADVGGMGGTATTAYMVPIIVRCAGSNADVHKALNDVLQVFGMGLNTPTGRKVVTDALTAAGIDPAAIELQVPGKKKVPRPNKPRPNDKPSPELVFLKAWPGTTTPPRIGEVPCVKDTQDARCYRGTLQGVYLFGLNAQQVAKLNAGLAPYVAGFPTAAEQREAYYREAHRRLGGLGIASSDIQTYYPLPGHSSSSSAPTKAQKRAAVIKKAGIPVVVVGVLIVGGILIKKSMGV